MKTAVIYGVTGQDGSYLAEFLLEKSYKVIGIKRRSSTPNITNIESILNNPNFSLVEGDIIDPSSVNYIIRTYQPDECYNLAAQSHVHTSFAQPSYTFDADAKGPLLVLEAIRYFSPATKFYQASTSEMFGSNYSSETWFELKVGDPICGTAHNYQDENTPLSPNSPYAIAKTAAHHTVRMYREAYGIFACAGILFNHESERRGENFVTRKITKYIGKLKKWIDTYHIDTKWLATDYKDEKIAWCAGRTERNISNEFPRLQLGNLDAIRDWGYAPDYVEAMWMMLQHDKPDDYIVGTEKAYSVKEFLIKAFDVAKIDDWQKFVCVDENLFRPSEVPYLKCRTDKIRRILAWQPKTTFDELVRRMVLHDFNP